MATPRLCTTTNPQPISHFLSRFPPSPNPLKTPLKNPLKTTLHVTLQYPSPQNPSASPQKLIWVNPKNPKSRLLINKSENARYDNLLKLANTLDSCTGTLDDVVGLIDAEFGDNVSEVDAILVLDNMRNAEMAVLMMRVLMGRVRFRREVRLYNVVMKVMKKGKDIEGVERLFGEMIGKGLAPDNVSFCTVISCARLRGLLGKCVEWFESMGKFGCEPDYITYSVMIDVYGQLGDVERALSLYDRARTEKWRIDVRIFSMVIKVYDEMKNFDGCLNVYQEMRALGVKPDLFIYTTLIKIYAKRGNFDGCLNLYEEIKARGLKPSMFVYHKLLDVLGRAKRPGKAKSIFTDMIDNGVSLSPVSYAALLQAYCRASFGEDAIQLYREMKEKGMELNIGMCNALLATCSDFGYMNEADEIFEDMKCSETCKPDLWTFIAMIGVCCSSGHAARVESLLNEMLEAGLKPDLFVLTSVLKCYGNANRTDDVVRTFDRVVELGFTPDEKFCACLLSVMVQTPKQELPRLVDCLEKANLKIGVVVKVLVEGENIEGQFREVVSELLNATAASLRTGISNCLIDLCVNMNLKDRARDVLEMAQSLGIYTNIHSKTQFQTSLHLKHLSVGAALTALQIWISDLSDALDKGEELPSVLEINTGQGKYRLEDKTLVGAIESRLKELNSPFHEAPDKAGWFLTTRAAAISWLQGLKAEVLVSA
ncbi:Pentatricopeptide repeat-containing protein [Drosera capensis]